ncbi:MAG TPA: gliding motility-associated C-terminal domain-containing protein [Bacteroidales bacterium]|nr:gliding motility-associated C-terminal domain-containing protein [Bacteroidales bacterium]
MDAKPFFLWLFIIASAILGPGIKSQNLVRNCDLETRSGCPFNHGQLGFCKYWYAPGLGTSDYLSSCNTGLYSVPLNQFGNQLAHSGIAYAHLILYYPQQGQYREYMQTRLACSLEEGKEYHVSFFVSVADDSKYAIDAVGLHFSVDSLFQPDDNVIDLNEPVHIMNTQGSVIDNKDEWVQISGTYLASGGERYITIGNFFNNGETTSIEFSNYQTKIASYYIDDISVTCTSPPLDLGNDTTICPYDSILIDVSKICDYAGLVWEDGSTELVRWIREEGTYVLQGQMGCSNFYDEITILHSPDPENFLPADSVICPGKTIELSANETFNTYLWQDGSNLPEYIADMPGNYWLHVTDSYGCSFSDTININGLNDPYFELGNDTLICIGKELLLDPGVDSAFHQFLWSDNSTGLTLLVEDSGYYSLKVSNPCGEYIDYIMVDTRNCSPALAIPNAFTPNGDGKNDIFMIEAENISNFRMFIYDRWGSKVFETSNLSTGWDGKLNGTPAPKGTYVWVIIYDILRDDWSHETKKEKGSIFLLR